MILLGQIVLICLLLLSISLWIGWYIVVHRVARNDPRLDPSKNTLGDFDWPSITICIPARNEEEAIEGCLESILSQDYPDFDCIVVDDRSSDKTVEIVRRIAERDKRVRLMQSGELPEGWTGKCYALRQASREARGQWLLFVDVDTRHHPLNLRTALREAIVNDADMVSLVCHLETDSFWEKLFQPLLGALLFSVYRFQDVNHPRHPKAFANGQYILIKREAYDAIGGHEAVRGNILEDIAMAFKIKRSGRKLHMAWGVEVSSVRMYRSFKEMLRGWSRLYCGAFGIELGFYLVTIVGWLIIWLLPWIGLAAGLVLLLTAQADMFTFVELGLAAASVSFALITMCKSYRMVNLPGRYALFYPLAALFLLAVLWHSLWLVTGRKTIHWRGREYAVDPDNPFGVF